VCECDEPCSTGEDSKRGAHPPGFEPSVRWPPEAGGDKHPYFLKNNDGE
jgi:hypothetical protein